MGEVKRADQVAEGASQGTAWARGLDADVVVVGAGPIGAMLGCELRLAGVEVIVLERRPGADETPRGGGLAGHILEVLRYRGLLERFEQASPLPYPAPNFPWAEMHVDFTGLPDSPLKGIVMPQTGTEELLAGRFEELGGELRRGHTVGGFAQDDEGVTIEVHGPQGSYPLRAGYLVGCDGARSTVRKLAGFGFPGETCPDVNRLAEFTIPDELVMTDDGALDVPGYGPIPPGFTRTPRGMFAWASTRPGTFGINTVLIEDKEYGDEPMSVEEFAGSIREVLGADVPLGEPRRLSRYQWHARQAGRLREGRVFVAGDAAHLLPAPGTSICVGMFDAVNLAWKLAATIHGWAPPHLLDSYATERRAGIARAMMQTQAQVAIRRGLDAPADALRDLIQELLRDAPAQVRLGRMIAHADIVYPAHGERPHPLAGSFMPNLTLRIDGAERDLASLLHDGRPVLLDVAGGACAGAAADWADRVDHVVAEADDAPAAAFLIRPDAVIAWAAGADALDDAAAAGLRSTLAYWFGAPMGVLRS